MSWAWRSSRSARAESRTLTSRSRRRPPERRRPATKGRIHALRRLHLSDGLLDPNRRAGAGRGGARVRVPVRDRAHPHSDEPAVAVRERRPRARREIGQKEAAVFQGGSVISHPFGLYPKRAETPPPPVLLGGESVHTLRRIVDFCDGWFPRGRNAEAILPGLADLRTRAAKAGRDPATISVSVFAAKAERATLDAYANAGITRAILRLPSEGRDAVLLLLDQYAKLIQ